MFTKGKALADWYHLPGTRRVGRKRLRPDTAEGKTVWGNERRELQLHNVECTAYSILRKYRHEDIPIPKVIPSFDSNILPLQIYGLVPFSEENTEKGYIIMECIEGAKIKYIYENLRVDEVKQVPL